MRQDKILVREREIGVEKWSLSMAHLKGLCWGSGTWRHNKKESKWEVIGYLKPRVEVSFSVYRKDYYYLLTLFENEN